MKGGAKVIVEPHRHEGIFVARGKEDALVTLNSTPGVAVYGEKRISVEKPSATPGGVAEKVEYRVWNPFRSKSKLFSFASPRSHYYLIRFFETFSSLSLGPTTHILFFLLLSLMLI